jgi:hypothetical protein
MRRPDNDSATKCTSSAIADDRAAPAGSSLLVAQLPCRTLSSATFFTDILGARTALANVIGYGVAVPPAYGRKE